MDMALKISDHPRQLLNRQTSRQGQFQTPSNLLLLRAVLRLSSLCCGAVLSLLCLLVDARLCRLGGAVAILPVLFHHGESEGAGALLRDFSQVKKQLNSRLTWELVVTHVAARAAQLSLNIFATLNNELITDARSARPSKAESALLSQRPPQHLALN